MLCDYSPLLSPFPSPLHRPLSASIPKHPAPFCLANSFPGSSALPGCPSQPGHSMFSSPPIDTHSLLSLFVLPSPAWGALSVTQERGSVTTESFCSVVVVCCHHLSRAEPPPFPLALLAHECNF